MTPPITKVSASIIIFDPIDRVLLAKRSFQKLEDPGLWETIGGTLEFGESPETCLRREVTEEIGCKIASLQLFNVYNYLNDNIHLISVVYLGLVSTGLAWLLRFRILKNNGLIFQSQVSYLIPIFGIILSYIFLDELITDKVLTSLLAVLVGLYFVKKAGNKKIT